MKKPQFFEWNFYSNLLSRFDFLFTGMLSVFIALFLFGSTIQNSKEIPTGQNLTFLTNYYLTNYHIKYDLAYSGSYAMSYPYPESVYFTGNQPLVINSLRFINRNIINISDFSFTIIYSLVALSFIAASIFLLLVFKDLQLNSIFCIIPSAIIPYLSPQIHYFTSNPALAYAVWIPLIIYLFRQFYKNHRFITTCLIGLLSFVSALFHLYYYFFFLICGIVIWFHYLFTNKAGLSKIRNNWYHIAIQVILPAFIIFLIFYSKDTFVERSTFPTGIYREWAFPGYLFLPVNTIYGSFLADIPFFRLMPVQYIYIGFVAVVVLSYLLFMIFRRLFSIRKQTTLKITEDNSLSIFIWIGFLSVVFSIVLSQLKNFTVLPGSVPFAWFFFFVINITSVHILLTRLILKNKYIQHVLLVLSLCFFVFDTWNNGINYRENIKSKPVVDNNSIKDMQRKIPAKDYEFIIPLPYFHIGSENFRIEPKCNIAKPSLLLSLQTGIPLAAAISNRLSIKQSINQWQLLLEPYRRLRMLKKIKSRKNVLLVVKNCDEINEFEKNILRLAKPVGKTKELELYSLPLSKLMHRTDSLYNNIDEELNTKTLCRYDNCYTTDTLKNFVYENYYGNLSNHSYMGVDAFAGIIQDTNTVFSGRIPYFKTNKKYITSFWFGNADKDQYLNSLLIINFSDSTGYIYKIESKSIYNYVQTFDKDWVLIEFIFQLKNPTDILTIQITNTNSSKKRLFADELLIRATDKDVYVKLPEHIGKNNRYFKIRSN